MRGKFDLSVLADMDAEDIDAFLVEATDVWDAEYRMRAAENFWDSLPPADRPLVLYWTKGVPTDFPDAIGVWGRFAFATAKGVKFGRVGRDWSLEPVIQLDDARRVMNWGDFTSRFRPTHYLALASIIPR